MSVEVKNLSFSYGDRQVLQDVSFTAKKGELLSILGSNGVGKSTLFRCMLGLLRGFEGTVLIQNTDIRSMSTKELARHAAYIPQNSAPVFHYSVFDVVLMGVTASLSPFSTPKKEHLERVDWALEKIGISHLANRCFHRISGGERQLVMIARALVQNAPVLMLDEPTANLDFGNQLLVLRQARALAQEGYTVIQTTHNPEQSYRFSDRILTLHRGKVLNVGTPQAVLTAETMKTLYGIETEIVSLKDDTVRICIAT